MFLFEQVTLLH